MHNNHIHFHPFLLHSDSNLDINHQHKTEEIITIGTLVTTTIPDQTILQLTVIIIKAGTNPTTTNKLGNNLTCNKDKHLVDKTIIIAGHMTYVITKAQPTINHTQAIIGMQHSGTEWVETAKVAGIDSGGQQ